VEEVDSPLVLQMAQLVHWIMLGPYGEEG